MCVYSESISAFGLRANESSNRLLIAHRAQETRAQFPLHEEKLISDNLKFIR